MADTNDIVLRIFELRDQGMTQQQIASEIGKSRSYVQKKLSTWGNGKVPVGAGMISRASSPDRASATTPDKWGQAEGSLMGNSFGQLLRPANPENDWITFGLDGNSWRNYGKRLTLPMLSMMSPGINRATWDYLRLLDPGHEILVFKPGTQDVDERSSEAIAQFIDERINPRFSSTSGLIQQLNMGVLYRGALCAQLVLSDNGREAREILVPDPIVIKFKAVDDEDAGKVWEPGIVIDGDWESVKSPLFHYVPFDPIPGDPYGRSIISASTFPSIFMLGLLYDLRRVVAQQGFTRTDIKVLVDKVKDQIVGDRGDRSKTEFGQQIMQYLDNISSMYSSLEPDDAWVHTDAIEVGSASGAVKTDIIGGAVGLLGVLERLEVKALKTMPIMMGITDNVSEANANRQWEIFVQGIKHIQHYTESILESFLATVLQVQGLQGDVVVRFAEIRSAEMLRDENTMSAKLNNAAMAEDRGYMSHEEASVHAVGHEPTGEKSETPPTSTGGSEDQDDPAATDADGTDDGGPDDDGGGQSNARKSEHVRFYRQSVERDTNVTRIELDTAVRYWKRILGDDVRANMLEAIVVGTREEVPDDDGNWYWVEEDRTFVYRGEIIDARDSRDAFGAFRVGAENDIDGTFASLDQETSSREVDRIMSVGWNQAKNSMLAGALLGVGGTNRADEYGIEWIEDDLEEQYGYWEEFDSDVRGEWMEGQDDAGWRAALYVGAGYKLFEHGRGRTWEVVIPDGPPLHPGCDCYVEYGEDAEGPYATWLIDGEMCPDCRQLAGEYQRYRGR